MAFYTVSVDESGKELERPKTARSFETRQFKGHCHTSARLPSNTNGLYVRYINPAAFIEKTQEPDTSDESFSEIVPPLDLNSSGDTLPSEVGPDVNYNIQKVCEVAKITKSDAFSNWLSAKRKLKSYELAKKKEIEEKQQQLLKEKRQLAEKKYEEWLNKKTQTKDKPPQREMQEYQVYQSNDGDTESNRRAWEQSKQEEIRQRKEEIYRANQRKKFLEEKRKKQAAKAWENWLAEAPLKPKPVPLNRGFLTLKGTVSDIFINPNPWQKPYSADEDCD